MKALIHIDNYFYYKYMTGSGQKQSFNMDDDCDSLGHRAIPLPHSVKLFTVFSGRGATRAEIGKGWPPR